jgi:hypothetical protein
MQLFGKPYQGNMTMRRYTFSFFAVTLVGAGILGFVGCQGNTDGGSAADPDYRDDVFVGDETSTGTIRVVLNDSSIPVGQTSGFKVFVADSKGQPIPYTRVICDSEKGVALIEPTSGYELTNGDGVMSGVIGCAAPGSYQMVCRLSVGANRRQFVSVACTGEVPAGFSGFPGAGGGGLGGGTQTTADGEIQITDAGFVDDGNFASSSVPTDATIDTVQTSDCDIATSALDLEPFYDTYAVLNVENNLQERVTLLYLECSVTGVDGTSNVADCGTIGLTRSSNSTLEANNDSTIIQVPVFKIFNGGKYVGNPTSGTGTRITGTGLYTVSFRLYYQKASDVSGDGTDLPYITASATAAFGNVNRCPSS